MIKAVLKYDSIDTNRVVKNLLLKKAQIKRMYGDLSFEKKIVCMFDDVKHMNDALYGLNLDTYHGVTLVKYHEVFDFKKWWKGGEG